MNTADIIAKALLDRLSAENIPVDQVTQAEQDGHIVINIYSKAHIALKSLTIHIKGDEDTAAHLAQDFDLVREDEGFVDHIDYRPEGNLKLTPAPDDQI